MNYQRTVTGTPGNYQKAWECIKCGEILTGDIDINEPHRCGEIRIVKIIPSMDDRVHGKFTPPDLDLKRETDPGFLKGCGNREEKEKTHWRDAPSDVRCKSGCGSFVLAGQYSDYKARKKSVGAKHGPFCCKQCYGDHMSAMAKKDIENQEKRDA